MSQPIERVEIITGIQHRRRYTAEEKVRLVEQTMQPGMADGPRHPLLPRDGHIFSAMLEGAEYPEAHRVATRLFEK